MNKILVFTEKKDYEGIFRGLYSPNGFQVRTLSSDDGIQITDDDHIIVVYPAKESVSLAKVIERARKQVSDLKIICASSMESSSSPKQFDPKEVDAYLTEKTTLGELQETIRRLMFPDKYQSQSSQTLNSSSRI